MDDISTPSVVRVLPCPSEPGRFHWHLFGDDDKPVSPALMSDTTYPTEEEARAAGDAALASHRRPV